MFIFDIGSVGGVQGSKQPLIAHGKTDGFHIVQKAKQTLEKDVFQPSDLPKTAEPRLYHFGNIKEPGSRVVSSEKGFTIKEHTLDGHIIRYNSKGEKLSEKLPKNYENHPNGTGYTQVEQHYVNGMVSGFTETSVKTEPNKGRITEISTTKNYVESDAIEKETIQFWSSGSGTETVKYDMKTLDENGNPKILSVRVANSSTGITTFYDANGQVTKSTKSGVADQLPYIDTFDANGNLESTTIMTHGKGNVTYNPEGEMISREIAREGVAVVETFKDGKIETRISTVRNENGFGFTETTEKFGTDGNISSTSAVVIGDD